VPKTGLYCKAYLLKQLREYDKWHEKAENARPEKMPKPSGGNGGDPVVPRELTDESIVYLQDDYMVTDDRYPNENVLYDSVTPEWKTFCHETLAFEIPDYDIE